MSISPACEESSHEEADYDSDEEVTFPRAEGDLATVDKENYMLHLGEDELYENHVIL